MENNERDERVFASLDEYKEHFHFIFTADIAFSRLFTLAANQIIVKNFALLVNHERHETENDLQKDLQGIDRSVKLPNLEGFGLRVRRDKPNYIAWADFTVDDKEWIEGKSKYYVYGYGNSETKQFRFYILFNYQKLKELVEKATIKRRDRRPNKDHSRVYLNCYGIKDLYNNDLILDYGGEPDLIEQILGKEALENRNRRITSFMEAHA
jgi:hypothetical protein